MTDNNGKVRPFGIKDKLGYMFGDFCYYNIVIKTDRDWRFIWTIKYIWTTPWNYYLR